MWFRSPPAISITTACRIFASLPNPARRSIRTSRGSFRRKRSQLPAGRFEKAVWIDYDHDYDLDLVLLGENSKLLRNNGAAGFSDQTADFPFVKGHALSATPFSLIADTSGVDLVVSYEDRAGVLYRDKLAGKYEAVPLDGLPEGADAVAGLRRR